MPKTATRVSAQDRREQIIQVAMGLFARQGYNGTTTRQIAAAAAVNEAIIFRHFPTKEDLYWAIIEEKCRVDRGRRELRVRLESGAPEREIFAGIAEDILRRNWSDTSVTRLLLFCALEEHDLSQRFFRTYIADRFDTLADYIRRRIAEGKFRHVDPLVAARGFLGMVVYHFLVQELFGGARYQKFQLRQVAEEFADLWLRGMEVRKPVTRPGNGHAPCGNGHAHRGNGSLVQSRGK